jgi:ATP-dependent Lon protease
MATALISTLTEEPVHKDVAMTGEITLRGRVLPIGGLKEKSLGALRAGIRTIIIPEKNQRDLSELPALVKRKLRFVPVKHMDEVLALALVNGFPRKSAGPSPRPAARKGRPSARRRGRPALSR